MAETVTVCTHLEPELKRQAEARLSEEGMTLAEAVVLLCERITGECGDPLNPHIPNAETAEVLRQARNKEGLVEYTSLDELKAEFG